MTRVSCICVLKVPTAHRQRAPTCLGGRFYTTPPVSAAFELPSQLSGPDASVSRSRCPRAPALLPPSPAPSPLPSTPSLHPPPFHSLASRSDPRSIGGSGVAPAAAAAADNGRNERADLDEKMCQHMYFEPKRLLVFSRHAGPELAQVLETASCSKYFTRPLGRSMEAAMQFDVSASHWPATLALCDHLTTSPSPPPPFSFLYLSSSLPCR